MEINWQVIDGNLYLPEKTTEHDILPWPSIPLSGGRPAPGNYNYPCLLILWKHNSNSNTPDYIYLTRDYISVIPRMRNNKSIDERMAQCAIDAILKHAVKKEGGYDEYDYIPIPYHTATTTLKADLAKFCAEQKPPPPPTPAELIAANALTAIDVAALSLYPPSATIRGKRVSEWLAVNARLFDDEKCRYARAETYGVVVLARNYHPSAGSNAPGRECDIPAGKPIIFNLDTQLIAGGSFQNKYERDANGFCRAKISHGVFKPDPIKLRLKINGIARAEDLMQDYWTIECTPDIKKIYSGIFFALPPLPAGRYAFQFTDDNNTPTAQPTSSST